MGDHSVAAPAEALVEVKEDPVEASEEVKEDLTTLEDHHQVLTLDTVHQEVEVMDSKGLEVSHF